VLDEFVYIVEFSAISVAKTKTQLLPPTYNPKAVKSPLLLLPVPARLLSQCPICKVNNKPLMTALLGGENRVICCDCYHIIKDMYGQRYTENSLTFGELYKTKNIDKVAAISSKM
jgi:hypothetical protein